jgi:hypothetical protein
VDWAPAGSKPHRSAVGTANRDFAVVKPPYLPRQVQVVWSLDETDKGAGEDLVALAEHLMEGESALFGERAKAPLHRPLRRWRLGRPGGDRDDSNAEGGCADQHQSCCATYWHLNRSTTDDV